jgi:hypothetical protein
MFCSQTCLLNTKFKTLNRTKKDFITVETQYSINVWESANFTVLDVLCKTDLLIQQTPLTVPPPTKGEDTHLLLTLGSVCRNFEVMPWLFNRMWPPIAATNQNLCCKNIYFVGKIVQFWGTVYIFWHGMK